MINEAVKTTTFLLIVAILATNASAGDATCTTKIMATDGKQQSLNVHQIEVKNKDGVSVLKETMNAITTTNLTCGKPYTAYIRKMEKNDKGKYTKIVKTRTRSFVPTKSSEIFINMGE
jgi:hypothetical protein